MNTWSDEGFWVPVEAGLLSTKAWLRGPFVRNQMAWQEQDYQMSKKATKTKYRWWFKTIGVNKTRSCACELKYLLLYKWFWNFFLLFQKNGSVGRWEAKHFMGMALYIEWKNGSYSFTSLLMESNTKRANVTCDLECPRHDYCIICSYDFRDADFENSLYAFGQSEKS